jgi:3-hydroxyisobutyrate dehydrogenase-like beta-hydroxyacid dehydrogenase
MAAGQMALAVGGSDEDIARARPVLDALGGELHVLGPLGAGMAAKVVVNGVAHATMVVLVEALALAAASGVALDTLSDLLRRDTGLLRPLTHRVGERIFAGDYAGGMSTNNARKDSLLALRLAQEGGVPLFATQAAHTVYELAARAGLGPLDYAAVARLWESWLGTSLAWGPDEGR